MAEQAEGAVPAVEAAAARWRLWLVRFPSNTGVLRTQLPMREDGKEGKAWGQGALVDTKHTIKPHMYTCSGNTGYGDTGTRGHGHGDIRGPT